MSDINNTKIEICLIFLLTLIGAFLRISFLDEIPPGLQGDEAWLGLEAQRIMKEGWIGIWTPAGWGQPTGVFYWTSIFFRFFPINNFTLRLSIALLGILTIPIFYFFVRSLFGKLPAAIGSFLLTFSYWHIHYSRTAYTLISVPLVVSLTIFWLTNGFQRKNKWFIFSAGIVSGFGLYTYRGYLVFPISLLIFWLFLFIFRFFDSKKCLIKYFLIFILPFIVLSFPMIKFIKERPEEFFGYMKIVSLLHSEKYIRTLDINNLIITLTAQTIRPIRNFFQKGPIDFTDGLGNYPLLDPVTQLLFIVGILFALFHIRDWRYFLLFLGIIAAIFPVAFSVTWGQYRRGITGLPMIFALCGIRGGWLIQKFNKMFEKSFLRKLATSLICFLSIFVIGWNVKVYFKNIGESKNIREVFCYQLTQALKDLSYLKPQNPYIYFFSPRWSWNYEARLFQAPDFLGEDRSQEFGTFSFEKNPNHHKVVYLLMPPYDQYLSQIQQLYPGGFTLWRREKDELLYIIYYYAEDKI